MKPTKLTLSLLFLVSIGIMYCCKDEPCDDPTNSICANYDPCLVYEAANADFIIFDSIVGWNCDENLLTLGLEIDSIWANRDVFFSAKHENDTYEWKIGTDTQTWTEKKFDLYFDSDGVGEIPVTLIVTKNDPFGCLSEEQRSDTLTKSFHVYFWGLGTTENAPPIIGSFRGVNEDAPLDTFIIEVPPPLVLESGIQNLPEDCPNPYGDRITTHLGFLFANGDTHCGAVCGTGLLQDDYKTLIVNYTMEVEGERVSKTFIGLKI